MTVADVIGEFSGGAAPYKLVVPPPGESPMKKRGGFNFIAEDDKTKINAYLALRRARFGEYQAADQFLVDLETGQPLKGFDTINEALRKAFLDAGRRSRRRDDTLHRGSSGLRTRDGLVDRLGKRGPPLRL
jgi:hypothetical protein